MTTEVHREPVDPVGTGWTSLVVEVLGIPAHEVVSRVDRNSFVALGGTSLQAIELLSLGQQHLSSTVDGARLLGTEPLGAVLRAAVPYTDIVPRLGAMPERSARDLLPGQRPMLAAHLMERDRPYHLMFTLEPAEALDRDRVQRALEQLVARNESLRTMFVAGEPAHTRLVLPASHPPRVLHQSLPAGHRGCAVQAIHELYGQASDALLRPFERPPVVFVLTRVGGRSLLTLLIHHVLIDGWSIGVLWHQFAELYRDGPASLPPDGPSPERIGARLAALESCDALQAAIGRVSDRLGDAPTSLSIPTDPPRAAEFDGRGARLVFALAEDTTAATEALARRCQVTVTSVLLAAWALVVARRTGLPDLLLGVPASGRFDAAVTEVVGLCTRVVPVRCHLDDDITRAAYVRGISGSVARAVAEADIPFERLVSSTGEGPDPARNPLVQVGFAAHHELVPDEFTVGTSSWKVHEGHCHGAVFDALLYLQSWSPRPRLALEYATCALTAVDAGELIESLETGIRELADAPDAPLAQARTISQHQSRRLQQLGGGGSFDTADDVWSAFERNVRTNPGAVAVVADQEDVTLTYEDLHAFVVEQSRLLHESGVRAGDRVALDLPRSAGEAVAVLAVLRLGAGYVAVDHTATPQWRAHVAGTVAPRARIGAASGEPCRVGTIDCPLVDLRGPVSAAPAPGAAAPDPARTAYVSFTSGSTGVPKGVVVSHRAVLRLAADPDLFADSRATRMLRLAPLAFDASTLELLVPFVKSVAVEVCPPGEPTPAGLTEFLHARAVTHTWLTSGLFHLVADHRPDAFRNLRQLFTGGGVVSPQHVRRVLDHCPGLRVTNGYGPTENTTFTTTFHLDSAHQVEHDVPIGRPVSGTDVVVLDPGGRPVPPGGIGELHTSGPGLADGYLHDPQRTAAAFAERGPLGPRTYRTGDLVRWGSDGQLRFLGRNDRQVKIAGHRVELVDVERRIKNCAGVLDAVVFLPDEPGRSPRLCAAVKLAPGHETICAVRESVEVDLAPYARPQRWSVVDEFPLNRNGKVDLQALAAVDQSPPAAPAAAPESESESESESLAYLEKVVSNAWIAVLGTDDFDTEEAFFDVGGDSLRLAMVRNRLRDGLGGRSVPLVDLYRFPTVQLLAQHLHTSSRGTDT